MGNEEKMGLAEVRTIDNTSKIYKIINNVGIYAYSSRNRIEGNVCNRNESTGISVLNSATNNMVVCNMAVENGTDYSVSTSLNIMGPAATSLTNHPWANYSR